MSDTNPAFITVFMGGVSSWHEAAVRCDASIGSPLALGLALAAQFLFRKRTRAATPVLTPQLKLTRPLEVSVAVGWARARRRVRRKLEVRRAAATPFHSRPRNGVP